MLLFCLIIISIIGWAGTFVWYFWTEIYEYYDNRFGPKHRNPKPHTHRRRMYD